MINIAIFVIALFGFAALAMSMPRHSKPILHKALSAPVLKKLKITGCILLAGALALGISHWEFDIGIVTWIAWLTLSGLILVLMLTYWPWQTVKPERPANKKRKRDDAGTPNEYSIGQERRESSTAQRSFLTTAIALLVLLIPLGAFALQIWQTPQKPTLRNDAFHGEIGPWTFVLAEKDLQAPEIMALGVPMKDFVVRFCDGCDAEISMAYLKIRKPHTEQATGNGFVGSQRGNQTEKTATVPVPSAAKLNDELWLTVESINGGFHQQAISIAALSPALMKYIQEQQ